MRNETHAERELRLIRALIANDAYAASFQTIGQYRRALLKSIVTVSASASKHQTLEAQS